MFGRIVARIGYRVARNPVLLGSATVAVLELATDIPDQGSAAIAVVVGMIVRAVVTPVYDPSGVEVDS